MKKIMFTLAAVACAATMQAAQFSWSAKNVYDGWDGGASKVDGTAYLFLVGGEVTEASIASAISGASDASALATTLSGKAIDTQSVSGGMTGGVTSDVTASAPANLFFVVISGDNAYQSAALEITTIDTLGATEAGFGSQKAASQAAAGWKAVGGSTPPTPPGPGPVPEPTSGLLLLVGGAMLALRRKQK